MRLNDKVVVLSGAAGGLGRAMAEGFVAKGARVALLDRDGEGVRTLAAALGAQALAIPCDITDEAACTKAIQQVLDTFGGVDVLMNNAGISQRSLFAETQTSVIEKVMAVNFFGAVYLTKAALPSIVQRKGLIAAVSSPAGFAPLVGRTGYAASKHALHGFFESLRTEVARDGVSVLMICPAFTRTGIDANALGGDGAVKGKTGRQEVGKAMTPEEVAKEVVRAVERRERLLLVGMVSKAGYWLSRLLPERYEAIMLQRQSGEFYEVAGNQR